MMDILERVKNITAETLRVDIGKLSPESDFRKDLEADSIDLFELVMAMEDAFQVELDDDAVTGITTISDVVRYLEMKM